MKDWTDAELGDLLRETFISREPLAEPTAATRATAGLVRIRRHWLPVAAAAAAVVLAIGTAIVVTRDSGATTSTAPVSEPTATPTGPTLEMNRILAEQHATRMLQAAPLMKGATPRTAGVEWPSSDLTRSDPTLTQYSSYSFPAGPAAVEEFLIAHPPAGMKVFIFYEHFSGLGPPTPVLDGEDGVRYLEFVPKSDVTSPAYAYPRLQVEWKALSGTTAVRFSTSIRARQPRAEASKITGTVSSVEVHIDWLQQTDKGFRPRTRTETVVQITELLATLASLQGTAEPPTTSSCMRQERAQKFLITVRDRAAILTYRLERATCGGQVVITRDGTTLPGTLDPWPLIDYLSQAYPDV